MFINALVAVTWIYTGSFASEGPQHSQDSFPSAHELGKEHCLLQLFFLTPFSHVSQ